MMGKTGSLVWALWACGEKNEGWSFTWCLSHNTASNCPSVEHRILRGNCKEISSLVMAFSAHFHSADWKHSRCEFIQGSMLFSDESLVSANYISASWLHLLKKKKKEWKSYEFKTIPWRKNIWHNMMCTCLLQNICFCLIFSLIMQIPYMQQVSETR